MAQRDYERHLAPPERPSVAGEDVAGEDEVAVRGVRAGDSPGADRIDRAPESGGAAAGADGRQDAGPGVLPE